MRQREKKRHEVIDKSKAVAKEKKEKLADKIFPTFDASTPDTKFNKKRFFEFFSFYPTADVKNIYCYSDQLGIDASYWFNFECHDSSVQKIIKDLQLKPDKSFYVVKVSGHTQTDTVFYNEDKFGGGLNLYPSSWWDTSFIKKSTPYGKVKGHIYSYLWYNKKNNKAYFLSFDM